MTGFKKAAWQVTCASLVYTLFCLIAMAILAAIVKACSPAQGVIVGVSWALKAVGCFLSGTLFLKGARVVYKGLCAGAVGAVLTLFTFAAIAGGFFTSARFILELVTCALTCAAGGLLGAKLHKDA